MLKIDKKSYKDISIYNIGYNAIIKIDDCENIYSVNTLYLRINHASGYIKEKGENMELIKKYNEFFNRVRDKMKEVCSDECDYEKDYMKIAFSSDGDLPLNKPLKFNDITITI